MKASISSIGMLLLSFYASGPATASTLYVTGTTSSAGQIYSLNTTTKVASLVDTTPTQPDSLFFDSSGRIIYTVYTNNFGGTPQIRVFNPNTSVDSMLMS